MYQKIKYRVSFIKKLFPYGEKWLQYILIFLILSLFSLLTGVLTPQIYNMFINKVILGGQLSKLKYVIIGYLVFFCVDIIVSYAQQINETNFCNRITLNIKSKILDNLFNQSFELYETTDIGEIKMRIEDDTSQIRKFVTSQSFGLIFLYLRLIVGVVLLFTIEWRLACFSIIVIPVTIIVDNQLSKREKTVNEASRVNEEKMSSWLHESLQSWREIKALTLAESQKNKYEKFIYKAADYFCIWINYWTARVLVIPKVKDILLMQFGLYFLGGILIMKNALTIGDLLVFAMYFDQVSQSIKAISSSDADLIASMPYTERLVAELTKDFSDKKTKRIITECESIVLENVHYTYPKAPNEVISNVSLRINRGDRIAITGCSGSGKTTLLKLITGMIMPTSGKILCNNISMEEVNLDTFHSRIGFVMQENALFNTTLRENLLYGDMNATDEELIDACRKAYLSDFIDSLPNGLETIIGERGIKLSGGQRQRLVLARLFLKSPDIYIFDEATSHLDPQGETFIHDVLRNIDSDKIIIVVSHRKSSLRLCNKNFSVEKGTFIQTFNG